MSFLLLKIKDSMFIEVLLRFGLLSLRECSQQISRRKVSLKSRFPRKKHANLVNLQMMYASLEEKLISKRNCYISCLNLLMNTK